MYIKFKKFQGDFLEKERLTFEKDKFEWREKYEEDMDVEEYMTTTMKELGLTKARSSVFTVFIIQQGQNYFFQKKNVLEIKTEDKYAFADPTPVEMNHVRIFSI